MAILKKFSFRRKKSQKPRGKLVVIDGIDGSGKSTQLVILNEQLRAEGFQTETIHFPRHGVPTAYLADLYLKGYYKDLNPYAASVFYAVDRFDASSQIRNWLADGKIVLSDRYVTANAGHQGCKISDSVERLKFFKWLDNLEYLIFAIPKPDLNIILNMPYLSASKLLNSRKNTPDHTDKVHEKSLTHLRLAQAVYLQIARLFPNTKLVECVAGKGILSVQEIHNKVWELVRRIALKDMKQET
ncbi:MAG: deoxynucleoside kinase [Candidatus Doudnabacteria bacterium]|nr:deoxynucleoside kinase [Candidatus Doudnabacteria bacterium]